MGHDLVFRFERHGMTSPQGVGAPVAEMVNTYDPVTGQVATTTLAGTSQPTIERTYDALGRIKTYRDADGSLTTTSYDGHEPTPCLT